MLNKSQYSQRDRVLTKALLNVAEFYNFNGKILSEIIGISESSITRLYQGGKIIYVNSKEGELVLLLLRLYRSLNAMVGNNHEKAKSWLNSFNRYFGASPIDHIKKVIGLVEVVIYLDAMRGKV